MKKVELDNAIRRALNILDKWNDVTDFVVKGTEYYSELQGVIEDAVHCGAQGALKMHSLLDSEIEESESIKEPPKIERKVHVVYYDGTDEEISEEQFERFKERGILKECEPTPTIPLRSEVYTAISVERIYQDSLRINGHFDTETPTVGEEVLMISHYADKAKEAWVENKGSKAALGVIRKIAALCVRAMENHGIVKRNEK